GSPVPLPRSGGRAVAVARAPAGRAEPLLSTLVPAGLRGLGRSPRFRLQQAQLMRDALDPELQRRLSVVVPAFNEENGVTKSVGSLRARFPGAEVLVVDDGSTDQTAERARSVLGVTVIRHA